MRLPLHTILLGTLLSLQFTAFAQWSDSSHVNSAAAPSVNDQSDPRIVPDGSGGAIVAWREFRPATGYDIFAARFDTLGYPAWPPGGVAICTTVTDIFDLRMASDGRGGAVIVWREIRGPSGYDLFAQRIDSNGALLWGPDGVAVTSADETQDQPQVTGDRFGGAIVAWRDDRNGTDYNVFAQRIDSAGNPVWTADGVTVCGTGESQNEPQLGADGGGGATIAWEDRRSGTTFDIYAQRIDGAGSPAWIPDGIPVSFAPGDQVNPRVATDAGGRAVIAWEDSRSGTSWDIYAQRLNTSGLLMWYSEGEAVCTAAQSQGSIDLADDGAGGSLLVWQDDRNLLSTDVYAQRLSSAGGIQWTPNGLALCTASNHQFGPRVVSLGSGDAAFAWYDLRNGSDYDVYAQRIKAGGSAAWAPDGVPVGTAPGSQVGPALAIDGAGGAIVAWRDGRGPANNVYLQNVLAGGSLGALPYVLATAGPNGSVSPAGVTAVEWGGSLEVTIHPSTGFHIDSVFVNGAYVGAPASYTFGNVSGDSTLHVVFAINVYHVTATAGAHGTISQPGATAVVHGQTQAYGITPDPGYVVGLLQIDGVEVDTTTYYLFTNITTNHTISVWFANDSTALAPISKNWNIVSAPLVFDDFSTGTLFPAAASPAYLFDGAYQTADVMENGLGYWMKFDSAEVVTLVGAPLHLDTINVIEGWNMVGSIGVDVPVGSIESVPGGIVTSQFFSYRGGYAPVGTVKPTRGYWVKLAQAGKLVLSASTSVAPENRIAIVPTDELPPSPPGGAILTGVGPSGDGGGGRAGAVPDAFRLEPNFPNPFNPSTTIRFAVPVAADVRMEVFSVTGERVALLIDGRMPAGIHSITWDASSFSGGVYFCRLTAGPDHAVRKLLLVR